MRDFVFHNPTKIIFGRNVLLQTGGQTASFGSKALLVSGRESLKKQGIYQAAHHSLRQAGIEVVEHAGVQPNPIVSHVQQGIALAQKNGVGIIVAVGGGSVIDSAKAIAAGALAGHDVWGFFKGKKSIKAALPVIAVPTVSGSGSETNNGMVLTNEATRQKIGIGNRYLFPKIAILDPTVTFSVPQSTTTFGAVDAFTHLLEFYLSREESFSPLQDHYSAGLMQTLMGACEGALANPRDYQSRAELMWASALALNGISAAGLGRVGFPFHLIEHSLSALHNIPHGAGLAAILPGAMAFVARKNPTRQALFATQIFGLRDADQQLLAQEGIRLFSEWLKKISAPTSLSDLNLSQKDIPALAANTQAQANLWRLREYPPEIIEAILWECL
ncbi:MAG: iron-containing alcohol dehydrogenase [Desulfobulbaceae bacterium]|nr:iron-containing alcohol dehydrogenase [Desulfobulbaceae bacterium]HIJ90054.1 iron-containing alcohol dehydrogenase [Deltaproteobacteria bacterium]